MNVLRLIYILDKFLKMMCCRKIALNTKFTGLKTTGNNYISMLKWVKKDPWYPWLVI